jgi:predicted DNA-binding transcriptional regulator AlpA
MTTLDGRRVYTRGDLMESYGLGRSTLEKLYRERDVNGHPEPVGSVGSQLAWDAEEWDRWYAARQASPKVPAGLVTRDELSAKYGLSRHALKKLWAERDSNGHPDVALQVGKALYWDEKHWAAWYSGLQGRPADDGDPDALVTLAEAARILGLAQSTATVYAKRPPAGWPEPVREEPLGGGRVRRLYRRGDVLAYGEARPTRRGS